MAFNERRPRITTIGTVNTYGYGFTLNGWGIGTCLTGCICHRGADGQLELLNEQPHYLGLVKHWACTCCYPWTPLELATMLRTLAQLETLPTTTTEESAP